MFLISVIPMITSIVKQKDMSVLMTCIHIIMICYKVLFNKLYRLVMVEIRQHWATDVQFRGIELMCSVHLCQLPTDNHTVPEQQLAE